MISENVTNILEENEFFLGHVEQQDDAYYAEVNHTSPAGEDFWATIWFDGSTDDFVRKFTAYARDFDVDDHIEPYAHHLGEAGVPCTFQELLDDANAIRDALQDVAAKLNGDDIPQRPELCTMMSLSTAHLRPETMAKLERCEIDGVTSYRKPVPGDDGNSYGAFVCIGDADREERNTFPADLAQIWDYCNQKGIWWVMFDCDAPMCSKFTDFTSEWRRADNHE